MPKMTVNLYVIEDYENDTVLRPKKTNPIKPNQTQFSKGQNELKIAKKFGHTFIFSGIDYYLS